MSEHLKKALVLLVALAPPGGALAAHWPGVEAHRCRRGIRIARDETLSDKPREK